MYTTTKVNTVIIINNKYITTVNTTFIRKLFFIKHIKATSTVTIVSITIKVSTVTIVSITIKVSTVTMASITIKVSTVIMANMVIKVNNTNNTNNTNNINSINNNNNLLLGQVELGQEEQGQQQERLALVEQQDMRDTWVINDC
ncbi:hypothetical protein BCM0075_5050 [Bacillus cereus]|nr:hypothetical protein BCM0075_5050 [Bacillus cereus]